jgi:hypothetical protein
MHFATRYNRRVSAVLLGLILGATVLSAAYVSASHESAAQQLISNLELHDRFLEERERYLAFMRRGTANPAIVAHVGEQLKLTNVMAQMTPFVAAQFSESELTEINRYLETDVGRKEYQVVIALVKERRDAAPGSVDVDARVGAFKRSLSPNERAAADGFRASPIGQKYWSGLTAIDTKLTEVFNKRCDEILQKLAASALKTGEKASPSVQK